MPALCEATHYAINVLTAEQQALAEQFARRDIDRWSGVDFTLGKSGAPLIANVAATFECFNRSRYDEGDHIIFVGQVESCTHLVDTSPLVYHGGRFYTEHLLGDAAVADEKGTAR
ncbi:FMN reductase (NADH) RutF [bioreactor metagenome]|uniref:FMN reductase (NADH) RutF n=1 Tax=bioreactor metagenome TaxID=1076179 RepID=A0A645A7Z9_9ZZZZ